MALTQGDRVSWNTSQGRTTGHVVDRRTKRFQHQGQEFAASEDEPYVIVESEKSGSLAAHKESSVEKA